MHFESLNFYFKRISIIKLINLFTSVTSASISFCPFKCLSQFSLFKNKIILVGRVPGQKMKMELVRNYVFLSELSTKISKSQIQNERKSHCAKAEHASAPFFPVGEQCPWEE